MRITVDLTQREADELLAAEIIPRWRCGDERDGPIAREARSGFGKLRDAILQASR